MIYVVCYCPLISAQIAWPVANHQLGLPTAMRDSLEDCVPAVCGVEGSMCVRDGLCSVKSRVAVDVDC